MKTAVEEEALEAEEGVDDAAASEFDCLHSLHARHAFDPAACACMMHGRLRRMNSSRNRAASSVASLACDSTRVACRSVWNASLAALFVGSDMA